jgi:prolyl 4-hydroxylase
MFHTPKESRKRSLPKNFKIIHEDPCVYLVDNVLTDKEIDHFDRILTQNNTKFRTSFIENESSKQLITEHRTSTYVSLTKGQDQTIRSVETRLAQLVGLSSTCVEPLQIVSYTDGQFFDVHHDAGTLYDDGSVELVPPKRLLTFFVYLYTLPEGQGHTSFPALNSGKGLSIRPQKGCGVLFCNILPGGEVDVRTLHRADPVEKGVFKYGVNIWFAEADLQVFSLDSPRLIIDKKRVLDKTQSALSRAEAATCKYIKGLTESCVSIAVSESSIADNYSKDDSMSRVIPRHSEDVKRRKDDIFTASDDYDYAPLVLPNYYELMNVADVKNNVTYSDS